MNANLIQQLANGDIAVVNDGTLEELRQVLKEAFTEDYYRTEGIHQYYLRNDSDYNQWYCEDITTLPTVSIKQFFNHE